MPETFPLDLTCQPVSLGNTCEAKLQICRKLNELSVAPLSDMRLRLLLAPPPRAEAGFGRGLFDWQVSSFWAVRDYVARDFQGVFEREDLEPGIAGSVLHKRLRVNHIHEFDHLYPDLIMTEEIIDEGYGAARKRFEHLTQEFRHHLEIPGRFLYVHHCEDFPDANSVRHAIDLFTERNSGHQVHFLFYGLNSEDRDLSELQESGWVTKVIGPRKAESLRGESLKETILPGMRVLIVFAFFNRTPGFGGTHFSMGGSPHECEAQPH